MRTSLLDWKRKRRSKTLKINNFGTGDEYGVGDGYGNGPGYGAGSGYGHGRLSSLWKGNGKGDKH